MTTYRLPWYLFTIIILSCLITSCTRKQTSEPQKPNIVFILVDDMGWKDLSCYGNEFHETPAIDQLAQEGIRFTDAYASCPVCSPTRASILTGKYPVNVNITDWIPGRQHGIGLEPDKKLKVPEFDHELRREYVTLAEALKEAGYVSASIGKWHLGDTGFLPVDQGFDINIAGNRRGSPPDYFWPFERRNREGEIVYSLPYIKSMAEEGDYLTDVLTNEAIKFVEDHADTSFFMYLPFYTVHIPLMGKEPLVDKYEAKSKDMADTVFQNPIYAAMIETLDKNVGRLVAAIDSLKLSENTVIFLTSDNGGLSVKEGPHTPATSNAPLRAGKGYVYEGGVREPLIVRWKGKIKPDRVSNQVITSVDFFPTIMSIVHQKYEGNIDGIDISPVLFEDKALPSRPVYWHYPHYSNQGGTPASAVREGRYKLIEFYTDGHLELYDLENDIAEQNNLANEMPSLTDSLYRKLQTWKRETYAALPTENPLWEGK